MLCGWEYFFLAVGMRLVVCVCVCLYLNVVICLLREDAVFALVISFSPTSSSYLFRDPTMGRPHTSS